MELKVKSRSRSLVQKAKIHKVTTSRGRMKMWKTCQTCSSKSPLATGIKKVCKKRASNLVMVVVTAIIKVSRNLLSPRW